MEDYSDIYLQGILKNGVKAPSTGERKANIAWIENLSLLTPDNKQYVYGDLEKQVLIKTTPAGEDIYIQLPGKESVETEKRVKSGTTRPWDFRPKVYKKGQSEPMADVSFGDIWAALFNALENLEFEDDIRALATIIYRLAYMLDHKHLENFETTVRDISFADGIPTIQPSRVEETGSLFVYEISPRVLTRLSTVIPNIGELSLEAFLIYNDLLALNEDCKYSYRANQRGISWNPRVGRINNLLTHMRVVGWVLGDVELADILNDFSQARGVSPVSPDEIKLICKGFLEDQQLL